MTGLISAILAKYPPLFWAAAWCALWIVPSLAGLMWDTRTVTGINPWIKPLKFETSVLVYVLTIGWMLVQLPPTGPAKKAIAWTVAVTMFLEIGCIVLQAARGVPSHFNVRAPFDAAVFSLMGIMIALNTLAAAWLLVLSVTRPVALPVAMVWGVRLGLLLFLIASAEGFLIVRNMAHTVGAPDGGPGLPLVNWSTQFGDLRVAHFVGMHGIQILPLLGWLASRDNRDAGLLAVVGAFVLMTGVFLWTLRAAFAGRPLVRYLSE